MGTSREGRKRPDTIRTTLKKANDADNSDDRRQYRRIPLTLTAVACLVGKPDEAVSVDVIDFSEGGAKFRSMQEFKVDSEIELCLAEDDTSVARILRCDFEDNIFIICTEFLEL